MKPSALLVALVIVLALALGSGTHAFAQPEALSPAEVSTDHVGQKVSVEGRVYSVNKTGGGIHLYFGADTSAAFQALVPAAVIYKFQVDIEKKYSSRNVRVTGKVEQESGKLFIRIDEPSQLKTVARKRGTS